MSVNWLNFLNACASIEEIDRVEDSLLMYVVIYEPASGAGKEEFTIIFRFCVGVYFNLILGYLL
jgi:hypothetical protein